MLYARAAALKRFCKQSRSRSGGSRESCLIRVFSVLLRGIWNIWSYMLVRRLWNVFVNKVDPDKAALVRAAWPGSTLFAHGDMKYLIKHKWILCDMLIRLLSWELPDQGLLCLAYGDMKYLIIYPRAAAFKRFCKQSKSGSGGSCESCLTRVYSLCKQSRSWLSSSLESCLNRVYSVCLWGYEISDHT